MSKQSKNRELSRRSFLKVAGAGLGAAMLPVSINGTSVVAPAKAPAQATPAAAPTGTLRVGWTPPTKLDPAIYSDAPDASIGISVYDYFVNLNQALQVVPSLAKSWVISPDGLTYTFTLQSGVKWHDGSAFTADDVKYTFTRLQDPKIGSPAAGNLKSVTAIDVVDPTTIKFTLKAASAVFLSGLADYHMAVVKNGSDPTTTVNGTGPFKTSKDRIDFTDRATFDANTDYWKPGQPKVASLELIFLQDYPGLINALKGGQLDWVARVPADLFADLKSDADLQAVVVPTNTFPNVRLRADRKPGNDPKVRAAFRLALDRDELNKAIYDGQATTGSDTPIGPLYKDFYASDLSVPKRDVAAAKKLLADAGYANGLTIDFIATTDFSNDKLAVAIQAQLKDAGITANVKVIDDGVYYGSDATAADNWLGADLAVTNWATRPDPQPYLDQLYASDGAYNEAHFSDPDLDKLIKSASTEVDTTKRAAILHDIQKLLIDHGPSFIPYFQPGYVAQSKKVSGIEAAADPGLTSFANATVSS